MPTSSAPHRISVALLVFALLGACGLLAQTAGDPSPHRLGMVTVNGVHVPYLDWGGSGPALVFIPGMGNSAHVFDDFSPRFTDRFRVIGVTRVGFGESDQPERDGYDLASRVAHIRAALDTEHITTAVLVGHSLGGDEITAFAVRHPGRTSGLIYLDAGIDHTVAIRLQQELLQLGAGAPLPRPSDLANVQAFQRFMSTRQGITLPLGEVLATTRRDASGVVVDQRAGPRVTEAIVAATVPPEFGKVRAPVLSLYSDYASAADMFPWLRQDAAENARISALLDARFRPEIAAARTQFVQAVKGAQVFAYPAHHYQFLSAPEDTEQRMRAFLASLGHW